MWTKLYKRECLEGLSLDEQEQIEDDWYNLQFVSRNPNMTGCFIDIPLYGYFIRANSLVTRIDRFSILNLARKCFRYANTDTDVQMKDILYLECIKRGLSSRYEFALRGDKANVKVCHELLKKSVACMKKGKMKYAVLVYLPVAYKVFRVIDDPTMLKYEKRVREEARKSKSK